MSANAYLSLVERRADLRPVRVLFVGPSLAGVKNVFRRDDEPVSCDHCNTLCDALALLKEGGENGSFDCIMVDQRGEGAGNKLHIASMAAIGGMKSFVVLCQPEDEEDYRALHGVQEVLPAPVDPRAIVQTIVALGDTETVSGSAEGVSDLPISNGMENAAGQAEIPKGFESSLNRLQAADQQVWRRFVPLANFFYKKLAIVILTALFLTFLSYGAMIVFFMASSSWSLPFELSRGHRLVEKAERDLSILRLQRNKVQQDITVANNETQQAAREREDADLQIDLKYKTTQSELAFQTALKAEIDNHIKRLSSVLADFDTVNGKKGLQSKLNAAYSRRLISKKNFQNRKLALLELSHRIASIQNEMSVKRLERDRTEGKITFLKSLLKNIYDPQVEEVASGAGDLSFLASDIIDAKNRRAAADRKLASIAKRLDNLQDSDSVVSRNVSFVEGTPIGRAIKQPVTVLFVPYTNKDNLSPGTPLYGCSFSIFWCSEVGVTGEPVEGEATSTHPLFGKPMRGSFVEAKFFDPSSANKELVHAGGAPLLF